MPTTPAKHDRQLTGPQLRRPIGAAGPGAAVGWNMPAGPSYDLYRQMRSDPTIALARMIVRAPVEGAGWSFAAADDATDEMVRFVQAVIEPIRPALVRQMLSSLDFGWQGFELIYETQGRRVTVDRVKPLLHDITSIRISRQTGRFIAFEQRGVRIAADKAMLFTYDGDGDDPYGRPRLENVREAWQSWRKAEQAAAQYDRKVAGVFPVIHYPPGEGVAADGRSEDNFKLAMSLARSLQAGRPIVVPNEFAAWADDRQLGQPQQRKWLIDLLEDRGGRQADFVDRLRYLDSLKFRGMLRPERAGLEAAHGTRADASAHGDLAMTDCDALLRDIAACLNQQLIDPLLAMNFGPEATGKIAMRPAPIRPHDRAALRDLIDRMMRSDDGAASILRWVDWDAALDQAGFPKSAEVVGDADEASSNPRT